MSVNLPQWYLIRIGEGGGELSSLKKFVVLNYVRKGV
jgi:hypothetical protein